MSQPNRKYKRLEALLSEAKPADPNPPAPRLEDEADALKARVTSLEAELQESRMKPQAKVVSSELISTVPEARSVGSVTAYQNISARARLLQPFINFSLRTKLITAFLVVTALAVGAVAYITNGVMRAELTQQVGENLSEFSLGKAGEIGAVMENQIDTLRALSFNKLVQDAAESASTAGTGNTDTLNRLDQQWRAADAANNNAAPLVAATLNNALSTELRKFRMAFPHQTEIFVTDRYGANIAATNRTSDYYQADEDWWQKAYNSGEGGLFIGQPEFDESAGTYAVIIAMPLLAHNKSEIVGILRTTVSITVLEEAIFTGRVGQTGRTDIYLPNGQEIELHDNNGQLEIEVEEAEYTLEMLAQIRSAASFTSLLHDNVPDLVAGTPLSLDESSTPEDRQGFESLDWLVVVRQSESEALQPVEAATRATLLAALAVLVVAGLLAAIIAQLLSAPIVRLTGIAERVTAGDLSGQARVESTDEIGILASSFNNMTAQLSATLAGLSESKHDLELASEVGRTVTEKVSNVYDMLSEATEMIRSRFGLYYTQVYLLDPSGHTLILRAGTGDVGRQLLQRDHHLLVSSGSLNGRAVSEKRPIVVVDTAKNPNFLRNPLLPNTRSEMVVPLIVSGRVLGVLDMQSEVPNALNQSNLPAFEILAGQLSVAIQNATLFARSEEARKEMEANVRQITESGWHDFLNAIERGEKIGYTFNQIAVTPMENAGGMTSVNDLNVPIMVTGANVGAIQLVEENRNWTAQETEIVQAAAGQLAQHLDNLRLLAQAESYRSEAEQAVRRLTREGWETFMQTRSDLTSGFTYDLNDVRAVESGKTNGHFESAITKQFAVGNETIGELAVNIGDKSPEEINDIMTAVAERLGDHIENLRLSEQNEMRSAELEKLVSQLRELDRLKSSFLANMSHELRTPLNSILGFADVMLEELDGPLTENMSNDLGLIHKNGQHLLHLINDVLDMAKIESGKMNLNPETVRVHEILEDVTSITSTMASDKNLDLSIEKDSDRKLEIFADQTRLRQVMINLVNNAIKFTEQGRISIHAKQENEHVLIYIKDTGIGIPPDKLEAVFQEFSQVDVSSTRKSGGTGLGLPISRRLVGMHGGRIWAESTGISGEGCTFYVELPIEAKFAEAIEKQEK